ncbi:MAG: Asp-tRNA(Asn)/Glu-tRNA(Gln) amidotransferase subunit GatC [Planctomycetota bacterium]|nr:Asp-tRNA(Asn)/Glu-tRNA(Gln) amidotransferase subunit GatC [Planctomycetota bacterium]MDA1139083.1 Asp-tRNA(Asn)/Glu-tRNA(Gln) amidotransferase subunit GatC [Planctomycetota bacterium]
MAKISKEQVRHVALLSRIEMSDGEVEVFQSQLENILEYMDKLDELDTSAVRPMSSLMGLNNVFREDVVQPSLPTEVALANAPEKTGDSFKVPTVVE